MAGDPFEPELVAAAAAVERGDGDRRARRAPAPRSRPPDRRTPPLPLPAPARPPSGLRRLAGRLAPRRPPALRRRARRGAELRRQPARTMSSARPVTATPTPSRSCAKRATKPRSARRPGRRAGSRAALRLLGDAASPEERVELLTALAGAQAATGQFVEARSALLESIELLSDDSLALRVQLTARARASSSCSVAKRRHTPGCWARSRTSTTRRRCRPGRS